MRKVGRKSETKKKTKEWEKVRNEAKETHSFSSNYSDDTDSFSDCKKIRRTFVCRNDIEVYTWKYDFGCVCFSFVLCSQKPYNYVPIVDFIFEQWSSVYTIYRLDWRQPLRFLIGSEDTAVRILYSILGLDIPRFNNWQDIRMKMLFLYALLPELLDFCQVTLWACILALVEWNSLLIWQQE